MSKFVQYPGVVHLQTAERVLQYLSGTYDQADDYQGGTGITSNLTGISVYAKVLDLIPDIKQNSGLLIIISNAAAQELGMGDGKFDCTLNYIK
jgi:hypothetical protein